MKNIVENVNDQCDESTYYYCWSGLDLNLKISTAVRGQRLKDIIAIYCSDRVHTVLDYADVKETRTKPCLWEGYSVKLHYNKKIQCTEAEFNKELSSSWKTINGLYMKEVNFARLNKTNPDQEKVWQQFINCHFIEYPNVCTFIQIMLVSAGNTSPLERGYSKLQMITSKRRNQIDPKNLETLFLLAASNIPVKTPDNYKEIERLSKRT